MPRPSERSGSFTGFLLLLAVVAAFFLWMCGPYLLAIAIGELLALLLSPLYELLLRRLKPGWAASASTLAATLLVLLPFAGLAAAGVQQGLELADSLSGKDGMTLSALVERARPLARYLGGTDALERQLRDGLREGARAGSLLALNVVKDVPSAVLQLSLALLSCFFFLKDGSALARLLDLVPMDEEARAEVRGAVRETAARTVWATAAAGAAQASIACAGFLALGVPGAWFAAIATFIFSWIPVLGSIPVVAGGALYLFARHDFARLAAMAVVGILAGTVDNLVRPLVLRGGGTLHPLLSLLAIFGGIRVLGVLGVFLGPVIAAVAAAMLGVWPRLARRHDLALKSESSGPR